ncbi:hypothetical protein [Fibrivirga algicola]|nr:hypothetical protein [Fibrivirga algicola]
MKKQISRQQHSFTDCRYVPLVAVAPALVGFENPKTATRHTRMRS